VPAIRDDHIFDVIGDTPHHRADHRAECSFATESQPGRDKPHLRGHARSSLCTPSLQDVGAGFALVNKVTGKGAVHRLSAPGFRCSLLD
jgi:hypothetical protein